MLFDFDKFAAITASVFPNTLYSLEDTLSVFRCYFTTYEHYMGKPHPPIKANQIVNICLNMPWVSPEDKGGFYADIAVEDYQHLIHKHFKTKYRNCDYNINHFFSGRIREMRFYEECY